MLKQKNLGASQQAIQDHYDLSNDFYSIWLDSNMVYSGALWQPNDDLETAQIRKLDHHIAKARAAQKKRVLDIGCGWGAMIKRLVTDYSVEKAVGLTLSDAQAHWVNQFGLPEVEIRVESWEDHQPEQPYDSIISVGAFEHFARLEHTESEKIASYRAFFEYCQGVLNPGSYLSLQTFAYGSVTCREEAVEKSSTQFLANEIFRETDPPHLTNIAQAIQGAFEIVDMHNDRMGYAKTCRVWLESVKANRQKIVKLVGEEKTASYERYLRYSYLGFQTGNLDLYRITLRRINSPWKK